MWEEPARSGLSEPMAVAVGAGRLLGLDTAAVAVALLARGVRLLRTAQPLVAENLEQLLAILMGLEVLRLSRRLPMEALVEALGLAVSTTHLAHPSTAAQAVAAQAAAPVRKLAARRSTAELAAPETGPRTARTASLPAVVVAPRTQAASPVLAPVVNFKSGG